MSKFNIIKHVVSGQHIREYTNATASSQEQSLNLSVKHYIPKDNPNPQPGDITVIGAHACGFPKELYEPLWDDLHTALATYSLRLRAVWILDCAWQGQSSHLNTSALGNDPSWLDYARDILHFTNVFRSSLPRPLVAMGHSFGGTALVNVATFHPRLFTSVILMDPVISRFASTVDGVLGAPAASSLYRREVWESREVAEEGFRKSSFYGKWDARVLKCWVEYGLTSLPTEKFPTVPPDMPNAVTLTTTKDQEVFTFLRPSHPAISPTGELLNPSLIPDLDTTLPFNAIYPFYRPEGSITLSRLPTVRPPVLYIHGKISEISTPELRHARVSTTGTAPGGSGGVTAGMVKEELLEGVGHLVAMEMPGRCAELAAGWIAEGMEEYEAERKRFEEFARRPEREKREVGKEWEEWLPRLKRPVKSSKI